MTEQEKAFHAEAEEKQRQILAEQSADAEGAVVASAGGHVVELHVGAGGIVIRAGTPDAVKTLGPVSGPGVGGASVFEELPCASSCVDPQPSPSAGFVHEVRFTDEQEQVLQDVIAMYDLSREKALERLWERVVARVITDEARQVLGEAEKDG